MVSKLLNKIHNVVLCHYHTLVYCPTFVRENTIYCIKTNITGRFLTVFEQERGKTTRPITNKQIPQHWAMKS